MDHLSEMRVHLVTDHELVIVWGGGPKTVREAVLWKRNWNILVSILHQI